MKVGDKVLTPYGDYGVIDARQRGFRDRADKLDLRWHYHVPSPKSGSPVEWWLAKQLRRA